MDGLREFLEAVHQQGLVARHLRGLFHVAIGRRITRTDGTPVSSGVTWRELAGLLKTLRFDKELGAEVGADPEHLSPRDRQRYWYSVIALARPDSSQSLAEAEELAAAVRKLGFVIGPRPGPLPKISPAGAPEAGKKPGRKKEEPPAPKRKK
jgi:hypothetical protein